MTAPMLNVRDLSVRFGEVKAVDKVSLQIAAGSLVGLIGTNGAGKTTVLDALTGFVRASGEADYEGRPLLTMPAHERARAGVVRTWQSLELFDDLTVAENVMIGQAAAARRGDRKRPVRAGREAAQQALDRVLGLLDLTDTAAGFSTELSQGQRKMVVLARALAMEPRILLADEPAAGLDTEESRWLGRRLRGLSDAGMTILLVDHDMGLVLGICDYIYVLDQGRLIAEGTPAQIRENPEVLAAYLGTSGDTGVAVPPEPGAAS